MTRISQEELEARLYLAEESILVFREFPRPTEETFRLIDERRRRLLGELSPFCIVVDVRDVIARPPPCVRAMVHQRLEELRPRIGFATAITGGVLFRKVMLKLALEFVLKKPHKVCATLEEGIEVCQEFLAAQS